MGVSAPAILDFVGRALSPRVSPPIITSSDTGLTSFGNNHTATFQSAVRAYTGNEIVAAGINLLATSAAEPHIIGRKWRQSRPSIKAQMRYLNACGVPNHAGRRQLDAAMVRNGFWEEIDSDSHPLIHLLNNPNPYTSRGQFWSQIVVDYYLAGNAYALKARYQGGILDGAVGELWRLRPDRMRPIPGDMSKGEPFVREYEYTVDSRTKIPIPASDVMHFKTQNPLDPYLGLAPLISLLPRVAIDTYMRNFLSTFYERGGAGVGAMLNLKGGKPLDQQQKDDVRQRFRRMFRGGQYDILVTSAEDATYTPFGLDRGLRDALPKEIDAVNEARIAMVLGIPGSILGLLIGYESSSYANKRADWAVFYDITMTPLLSGFDDVLNLSLVPEFGGVDEVTFDLSDIRALQEDIDALHERARKNVDAALWTLEEGRVVTGVPEQPPDGDHLLIPTRGTIVPTPIEDIAPEHPVPVPPTPPAEPATALLTAPLRLNAGRPRLEDDPGARAIHDQAVALKARNPYMTWEQVAANVGVAPRTLRDYRNRFCE